jgi:hypothetical protein
MGQKKAYPPLAPGVNDAVTKDQATSSTHEISRSEFLDNCWVWVSAVQTDETDGKVRRKGSLLRFWGRSKWKGLSISHYRGW